MSAGHADITLNAVIEALLFGSDEPLSLKQVAGIVGEVEKDGRRLTVTPEAVVRAIDELNRGYEQAGRAFRIVRIAGGYQFATRPEYGVWLGAMLREKARRKLSASALESLAVIAYKQPVTKPELEAIRGVNADYILRSLLERNLITIVGRAATPGRPLLYGTTREFLKHFGLDDLADLPKPREIDELLAEAELEVEKRLLAERAQREQEAFREEEGDSPDADDPASPGGSA